MCKDFTLCLEELKSLGQLPVLLDVIFKDGWEVQTCTINWIMTVVLI